MVGMTAHRDLYVAVVGPGRDATDQQREDATRIGAGLARSGAVVLTGGMDGVMQAAAAGCRAAGGTSIGLLPDRDRARANPESSLTIPTGLGELRNGLLVRAAHAVVAVAPSWGTLSEVALAVRTGVPVLTLGEWSLGLPGPVAAPTPDEAVTGAIAAALRGAGGPATPAADTAPVVHHVTLTVTDVEASSRWYQELLGPASLVPRSAPGWRRIRMQWPGGLVIGVTEHEGTPITDRFDHRRTGLDHVGLACSGEAQVRRWAERLDQMGAARGPVEDVPYGWAVTGRDPDNIPVEFFAPA
jgi:uncharacterized protein (TIGR00725 family)